MINSFPAFQPRGCLSCGAITLAAYCDACRVTLNDCAYCGALTPREACMACVTRYVDPVFGKLRDRVREGELTDFDRERRNHVAMQTLSMNKPVFLWTAIWTLIKIRAYQRGFGFGEARHVPSYHDGYFHPEYFTDEGKAA